jgi:hypothetical protein
VDEGSGEVFYSVGEHPLEIQQGNQSPAKLACLEFEVIQSSTSTVCLLEGDKPTETILINEFGHAVKVDNTDLCPTTEPPPVLGCVAVGATDSCTCPGLTTDCSLLDSQCSIGICNEDTVACELVATNNNAACDDGEACTSNDRCTDGVCLGTGCDNPSLCIVAEKSVECGEPGGRTARVVLGASNRSVVGGQFSIDYDPNSLIFVQASPGYDCDPESPFTEQLAEVVDEATGQIFYSVGVNPFAESPDVRAGATLACLEFDFGGLSSPEVCLSAQNNPLLTVLAGLEGSVPIYNGLDCPSGAPPPAISCDDFCVPIPTASLWGLVVLTLALLTIAKCCFHRHGPTSDAV